MNNLVKIINRTSFKNNRELLLRLYRNADRVYNVNHLSENKLDTVIKTHREKFNCIINIRTYASQLSNENVQRVEENSSSDQNKMLDVVTENGYVRNYLQSSIHYAKTVYQPNKFKVVITNEEALQILDKDWSMADTHELVCAFRKLSYNITSSDTCIDGTKYSAIFDTLHKRIAELNDDMLEEVLKCLIPLRDRSVVDMTHTFKLLDEQCEKRYLQWSIDKMFLICDIFYCLRIHKSSNFIWKLKRKINSKLNKLTPKNLVQLMFLVNISRKAELNMYEVEIRLEEYLNDFSIQELGIIAMGYFKSKSKIRNSLFLRAIINRLICELDQVDSVSLAALIKLIRYSMHHNETVHFRLLLNKITAIVPKLELMCLTHIAHASAKANVYEKPLVDAIIERLHKEIKGARMKDLERLGFMLATFNIDINNPIYDAIIKEVTERANSDKVKEILEFPYSLPCLLWYLSLRDIYPTNLLEITMDPSYLQLIHKGNPRSLGFLFCLLQHSIAIDRPEYTGPFIEEGLILTLTKLHWTQAKDKFPNSITRMFNEIVYILKETIANGTDLYIGKLLPHYLQNDIVIGIDENQNPISAEPILSGLSGFTTKRVDHNFPKNVKWIAFIIIHYNHKIKGTNEPVGIIKAKMRQLERIGYIPVLITDDDWLRCKNFEENAYYLKNLIKNV